MNTRTVYRFEHATNKDLELWYMKDGSESGLVHKLNLSSKEMPMGRDDSHYVAPSGHRYHCSAPNKETLQHWFSVTDYPILRDNDFVLVEYIVSEFLEDGPQTLFTMEGVISQKVIPYAQWECKTLHLVLKKQWYDMIASGEKTEEYRELKAYWWNRLSEVVETDDHYTYREIIHYDRVTFYLGYAKNRPSMTFSIKEIGIRHGKPEWGAEPGKMYFVICLGDRL